MHIFALLSLLLAAVGCVERGLDKDKVLEILSFSVEGKVYDALDADTPLRGITVTMTAYATVDAQRLSPLSTDSYSTLSDGSYQFFKNWPEGSEDVFYVFDIVDPSGKYQSMERDLYLSASSPFYKAPIKSYEVTGNDFSLSPAAQ